MPSYLQRFTVVGRGPFPVDMLRYDTCFPLDTRDAKAMGASIEDGYGGPETRVSLGRIVRRKDDQPTIDRWSSFGWTVLGETIQTR